LKSRKAFLIVLAENEYQPLKHRSLIILLSSMSLNFDKSIIVQTSKMEDVFRNKDLVQYITKFIK